MNSAYWHICLVKETKETYNIQNPIEMGPNNFVPSNKMINNFVHINLLR